MCLFNVELTRSFHVYPVAGKFDVRDVPRDVPGQHLVVRVVRVTVRKVHGYLRRVRRQVERRSHTSVDFHLLGARVVLDHVPRPFNLQDKSISDTVSHYIFY